MVGSLLHRFGLVGVIRGDGVAGVLFVPERDDLVGILGQVLVVHHLFGVPQERVVQICDGAPVGAQAQVHVAADLHVGRDTDQPIDLDGLTRLQGGIRLLGEEPQHAVEFLGVIGGVLGNPLRDLFKADRFLADDTGTQLINDGKFVCHFKLLSVLI